MHIAKFLYCTFLCIYMRTFDPTPFKAATSSFVR